MSGRAVIGTIHNDKRNIIHRFERPCTLQNANQLKTLSIIRNVLSVVAINIEKYVSVLIAIDKCTCTY